jgi:hypothetical protein
VKDCSCIKNIISSENQGSNNYEVQEHLDITNVCVEEYIKKIEETLKTYS